MPVNRVNETVAIVCQAEDLAKLATRINTEHEAGEGASRKGLEHFRSAGEALIRAKRACGHGNFGTWLKSNVRFNHVTACSYMKIAREWPKISTAENMRAALRLLTEDTEEPKEGEATVFAEKMREVCKRVWGVEHQYGSVDKMMESPEWATSTAWEKRDAIRACREALDELTKFVAAMEQYEKDRLTESNHAKG